jgi:hypothetical protein
MGRGKNPKSQIPNPKDQGPRTKDPKKTPRLCASALNMHRPEKCRLLPNGIDVNPAGVLC